MGAFFTFSVTVCPVPLAATCRQAKVNKMAVNLITFENLSLSQPRRDVNPLVQLRERAIAVNCIALQSLVIEK